MDEREIPQLLDRYLKGKLSEEEKDRLWEEFIKHPEYLEWLEIEVTARDYLKNPPGGMLPADHDSRLSEPVDPARRFPYVIAAAAAIILALSGLIGYLLVFSGNPAAEFAVSQIPPNEMKSTVILRGPDPGNPTSDIALNAGVEAALSRRLEESMDHFSTVLSGEPNAEQRSMALFNMGVLHYNDTNFRQAESLFLSASTEAVTDNLREDALWWRSHALLQLGETTTAVNQLEEVVEMGGIREESATALIDLLRETLDPPAP